MQLVYASIGTITILLGMDLLGVLALAQPSTDKPIGILLAAGDIATCGKCDQEPRRCYANKTAEIIRKVIEDSKDAQPPIPVRVLALGDLAYGEGTEEQCNCFQKRWHDLDDVLLPVPGNHEYKTENAAPYFTHFKNNFPRISFSWASAGMSPIP
jgi:acid phosphatase type 7